MCFFQPQSPQFIFHHSFSLGELRFLLGPMHLLLKINLFVDSKLQFHQKNKNASRPLNEHKFLCCLAGFPFSLSLTALTFISDSRIHSPLLPWQQRWNNRIRISQGPVLSSCSWKKKHTTYLWIIIYNTLKWPCPFILNLWHLLIKCNLC